MDGHSNFSAIVFAPAEELAVDAREVECILVGKEHAGCWFIGCGVIVC
jgi:hypothetical protein